MTSLQKTTDSKRDMADNKQDVELALQRLLSKGDELDRCCVCRSLGVLGSSDAVQPLVEHLRDDDIDVCIDAAESLGLLGEPAAVAPLIESLHNDPDGEIRVSVVEALGRLGGEQAVSALLSLLTSMPEDTDWDDDDAWDSNWDIQRKAVQALGYQRVAKAVAPLTALLDDEDAQVDETDSLLALARIGGAGEELVIQRLQNGSTRERRRAAHALGQPCSPTGAHALGRALQDPEPEVRAVAAEALANNGQGRYLGALLLLLRDPADEVRETALKMIDKLSSHVSAELDVQQLLPLLSDPSTRVRAAALHVLQGHLPDPLEAETQACLVGLLSDSEPLVAAAALPHALRLEGPDIDGILLNLLADEQRDPAVRQQAALALGNRPQTSEEILTALDCTINDHEPIVRWAALQALMACHKKQPDTATLDAALDTTLDTQDEAEAENEPAAPLARILAALYGETDTATATIAPTETTGDDPVPESPETTSPVDISDPHEETEASSSNETAPESTLDAILLANTEYEQLDEKKKTITTDELPELPAGEDEAFQDFYDILARQRHNKKKFYRGKNIDIEADIRLLSARVLGECSQPEVVEVLRKTMLEDNPELQQEAIDALARLTPDTPGLTETLGPLNSLLHMGTSELRVASARALGALGNLACLPNLQESLEDENPLVRSQSVMAMAQILERHTDKLLWEQHADTPAAIPVASARAQDEADTIEQALHAMSERLADSDVGVSKAAALSLAKLNRLLSAGKTRDDIIERLITAGFVGEGRQAREMGQALRVLDPGAASNTLIQHLDTLSSSIERQFVLEMLEEVFRPSQAA
ncbi:MAG: HEAT repeat domain-containing protein [Gammaproteobacteria bacterium]|nr:HEAT repeat domain-containing protein [Gammaproteobacteria bacterium]